MTEVKIPQSIDEIDVSDFERWIGVELPQNEQFNYDVTRDTIRHFAYGINDYNALYLEPDFAATTRFGGIIAPPGYLYSHGNGVWARVLGNIPGITMNDNAGEQWEFLLPVRPGDRVVTNVKAHKVEKRQGRRSGPLVLVFSDTTYTNQRGELVARNIGSSFRFSTRGVVERGGMARNVIAASGGKLREIPPAPRWAAPGHPYRLTLSMERWYNSKDVYWDDVKVGDELPSYDIGILHPEHLQRYSAGTGGGFPLAPLMDPDSDWAKTRGDTNPIPTQVAGGVMRTSWFGTLISKWAGPNAWITRLAYQNREWNLVGYGVICKGRVTGKRQEGGHHLVDLDVWAENDMGMVTNPGTATVELLPARIRPGTGVD